MTIRYLDIDPRTPEEREIDEEVYKLAEAGKFSPTFQPPKPRKRPSTKRPAGKRRHSRSR